MQQSKMVLTSKETPRKTTWDHELDLYIHIQKKNRVLKTEIDKFNYFNTLLQAFLLKDPKADSEWLQYLDSSSSILHSYVLHLQNQNQITEVDSQSDSVVVDPQYEYFRNHLKPHGKSYVLDLVEDCGVFVKYENESSCEKYKSKLRVRKSKDAKLSTERGPNVNSNIVASKSRKCSRGKKLKGAKLAAVNIVACKSRKYSRGADGRFVKGAKLAAVNIVACKSRKYSRGADGRFVSSKATKQRRKKRKKHAVPVNVNRKGVSAVKAACIIQTKGQNVGHGEKGEQSDTPSGIETRVKEEIEDYHDDDDALVITRPADSPVLNMEYFWCENEANARNDFKEKLMNELKRPYCEEEYKRLLQEFTVRKPVQHHKNLRHGVIKTYEKGYLGKSFHDHNLDLAREIDSAHDDHPKCLTLLRGFFFWLSNLTHEGAFMPWRVKEFH